MAIYAIGDIQGCAGAFGQLLKEIQFKPGSDRLWLVGDLVNRGPASLDTLRQVRDLGDAATTVLGNHDLHLLALAAGARKPGKHDTLDEILDAPDATELLDWLRQRPLAHHEVVAGQPHLLVHAGLLPIWSVQEALVHADEVASALRAHDWRSFFLHMYGDEPSAWSDELGGYERLRVAVNALTRLRFCDASGVMDLKSKEGAGAAPPGFQAWFDIASRRSADTTVVFGHWSTLGLLLRQKLIGLDSGCVWGGALTAVRLPDRQTVQVACPQYQRPG